MTMLPDKRRILSGLVGTVSFLLIALFLVHIVIKHYDMMNLMLIFSIGGGLLILAGMIMFMMYRDSYFPAMFVLMGLGQQGLMLFVFLKIKIEWGAAAMGVLSLMAIAIRFLDPLGINVQTDDSRGPDPADKHLADIINFAERVKKIRKKNTEPKGDYPSDGSDRQAS